MWTNYCMRCKHFKVKEWMQRIDRWHTVKQTYGYCTKQKEKCRKLKKCWFFEMKEEYNKNDL